MTIEAATAATSTAARNAENARKYAETRANSASWTGPNFDKLDFSKLASALGASPLKTNVSTTTLNDDDNQHVPPAVVTHKETSGFSNVHNSYVPKMLAPEHVKEPSPAAMNILNDTECCMSLFQEIAESSVKFFASIPKQITILSNLTSNNSTSLWKLQAAYTEAAGKRRQDDIDKANDSAKSAAEKMGRCAEVMGAVTCALGLGLAVLSVAAIAVTGGASAVAAVGSFTLAIGALSNVVFAVSGIMQAIAGQELINAADSNQGNIFDLIEQYMPELQFGIFNDITGDKDKASQMQQWFNIATTIVTFVSSGFEMAASRAVEGGVEMALTNSEMACKAYSATNSLVSVAGMIANAADPSCKPDPNDANNPHMLNLYSGASMGILGVVLWAILEKIPVTGDGKSIEDKLNDGGQYATLAVETVLMLAASVGTNFIEAQARAYPIQGLSPEAQLMRARTFVWNMILQTVVQSGQSGVAAFQQLGVAQAMGFRNDSQKISSETQVVEALVTALTAKNSAGQDYLNKFITEIFQNCGSFFDTLKDALNNQTKAIKSLVA